MRSGALAALELQSSWFGFTSIALCLEDLILEGVAHPLFANNPGEPQKHFAEVPRCVGGRIFSVHRPT
jgi:hypothetical protein